MTRSLVLTTALAAVGGALMLTPASAIPLPAGKSVAAGNSSIVEVQYGYGRCRHWRRECASRWGWGTWRFHRCMRNHGC
jgi:hypothetical protein